MQLPATFSLRPRHRHASTARLAQSFQPARPSDTVAERHSEIVKYLVPRECEDQNL
jgi:hypothetical protein